MKNVTVGYPCYDSRCEAQAMQVLMQCLMNPNHPVSNILMHNGDSLVTRARNKTAHDFLHNTKNEWLMFIDSDIIFQPSDIERLISHNKPLIGGIYFKKKIPYSPVANRKIREENGLFVMGEIGTGFMLIHRDVLEEIRERYPERTYKNEGDEAVGEYNDFFGVGVVNNRYLSEDYYFCHLAKECGYEAYLDPSVVVRHVGRAVFPFDDESFLEAGADFLHNYDLRVPLRKDLFERYEQAVEYHKKERTLWT